MDHQHSQQVEQIRNLKDRLAIETARANRCDSTFNVDKGSPQNQVICIGMFARAFYTPAVSVLAQYPRSQPLTLAVWRPKVVKGEFSALDLFNLP